MTLQATQARIDDWIENTVVLYEQDLGLWWRQKRWYQGITGGRGYWQGWVLFDVYQEPNHNDANDDDKLAQYPDRQAGDNVSWATFWPELMAAVVPCNIGVWPTDGRAGPGWEMSVWFQWTDGARDVTRHSRWLWFEGNQRGGVREWLQQEEPIVNLSDVALYLESEGWRAGVLGKGLIVTENGNTWMLTLYELLRREWPRDAPRALIRDLINYLADEI